MTRFHVRFRLALAVALAACLLSSSVLIAGDAKALTYRGGGQGTVIFDHARHTGKGYTCRDCHTMFRPTGKQLFQTQKQGFISIADHNSDNKCFACHNDKIAFTDCAQCHRK
jgi:c(7)-type cytochrome triheme protein